MELMLTWFYTFCPFSEHGILQEFKGKYSNEIWPHVHKFMGTQIAPNQYTEYS